MAIACAGCGRQYDVTLFEYGRTLRCACGARVALEHRIALAPRNGPLRVFADAMLERLARWLRLLGVDCAFERGIGDADLVRRATDEGRVILTRDRALVHDWSVGDVVVLASASTVEQLAEIVDRFDLANRLEPFTRCSRCNATLEPAAGEDVAARVPPRVSEQQTRFFRCPDCDRVYWEGSHTRRIRSLIEQISSRRVPR